MPDISTKTITQHTVVLTDAELDAVREAARLALLATDADDDEQHRATWKVLRNLGKTMRSGGMLRERMPPSGPASPSPTPK